MNELVQPLTDLTPEAIDWLWPGNLSFGNLAIFDGDPGLGKSLVALDLCARLSTGRPFPGAQTAIEPSSTLVLNAEDDASNAILPRLRAMGADLSRIHVLRRDFLDTNGGFRLPQHTAALEKAIADTNARLIVIDPIMAFLDKSVNIGSDQSVRGALRPLLDLAVRHSSLPLLIRHINKMLGTHSIYRGSGSIAFQAACRSSWQFGRDPVHKERCVMAQVKNNYAPLQPSLAYAVQGDGDATTLEWLGTSNLSANQLLAVAGRKPVLPGKILWAGEFLLEYLQAGPRPTIEIWPAAQKLGFTRSTLRLARKRANIRIQRTFTDNKLLSFWLLPGQNLAAENANDAVPDIRKLLQPLIDQYPTTPIDR